MIGIICAMSIEVDGLKEKMSGVSIINAAQMDFTQGTIEGVDVVCVQCGIGKVNAAVCTQLMIDIFKPAVIINSGVAGALCGEVSVGDIVIASDVVQHDMNVTALGDPRGMVYFTDDDTTVYIDADKEVSAKLMTACASIADTKVVSARLATGDIFVSDRRKRLKINSEFGAVACEMEGGAIAQTCHRNAVPFAILRCISDDINNEKAIDYMKFKKIAADKSVAAVLKYLEWLV